MNTDNNRPIHIYIANDIPADITPRNRHNILQPTRNNMLNQYYRYRDNYRYEHRNYYPERSYLSGSFNRLNDNIDRHINTTELNNIVRNQVYRTIPESINISISRTGDNETTTNNKLTITNMIEITELFLFNDSENISDIKCPICKEDYCDGDIMRKIISCDHCYHANCFEKWLSDNSTCPICRMDLLDLVNNNETITQSRDENVESSLTGNIGELRNRGSNNHNISDLNITPPESNNITNRNYMNSNILPTQQVDNINNNLLNNIDINDNPPEHLQRRNNNLYSRNISQLLNNDNNFEINIPIRQILQNSMNTTSTRPPDRNFL